MHEPELSAVEEFDLIQEHVSSSYRDEPWSANSINLPQIDEPLSARDEEIIDEEPKNLNDIFTIPKKSQEDDETFNSPASDNYSNEEVGVHE